MKNIFLLPTEEPSRLHGMLYAEIGLSKEPLNWRESKHMYITSNEKIEHNDWFYALDNTEKCIQQCFEYDELTIEGRIFVTEEEEICIGYGDEVLRDRALKILFTTDPMLISRGVQSIDDSFLQRFISHPRFDFVDIKETSNGKYELIIPKAESISMSNSNPLERFEKDSSMLVMPLDNEDIPEESLLEGFIEQFGDGIRGELDPGNWNALEFLEWLKLNKFEIIKKK